MPTFQSCREAGLICWNDGFSNSLFQVSNDVAGINPNQKAMVKEITLDST
jgi:hypothetical protein